MILDLTFLFKWRWFEINFFLSKVLRDFDQDDLNVQLEIFDDQKEEDAIEFQHRFNDIAIHFEYPFNISNVISFLLLCMCHFIQDFSVYEMCTLKRAKRFDSSFVTYNVSLILLRKIGQYSCIKVFECDFQTSQPIIDVCYEQVYVSFDSGF